MDFEITRSLSDTAIIARARSAIMDVKTVVANSLDTMTESKQLLNLLTNVGTCIKADIN